MPIQPNFSFLNRSYIEGPQQCLGYIPCWLLQNGQRIPKPSGGYRSANFIGDSRQPPANYQAMGASGVTIATGCDLGQTNIATLQEYAVAPHIIQQLSPYIGRKRDDAINALHITPLAISQSDAQALDDAIHNGYLNKYVIPNFDRKSRLRFADQAEAVQTIYFSIIFQRGCTGADNAHPNIMAAFHRSAFENAARMLMAWTGDYAARRNAEGKYLMQGLR